MINEIKSFEDRKQELLKKGKEKYIAFSVGAMICFLIFDYGCVTYNLNYIQILLALSFSALSLESEKSLTGDNNE